MPIPSYQMIMTPMLDLLTSGQVYTIGELIERMAEHFGLTPEERRVLIPSGTFPLFNNRVHWCKTYLKQAGLLEQPQRGKVRITPRGREALRHNPAGINLEVLEGYTESRNSGSVPARPR